MGPSGRGRRARGGGGLDAWPGYVDALSTLLMVIIFVLLVFVLAQGFLSVALSSRDRALDRLNRQVAELAELLSLERGQTGELRNALSRTAEELRGAATARDALQAQLRELREERDRFSAERDAVRGERDQLTARLTDLELTGRGAPERIASLERQLAEALQRAETTGGDAAQTLARLTETTRNLAAERTARQQQEARAADLDRQLGETRGAVETARQELAGLRRQLQEAAAQLAQTQQQLAAMRQEMAALDRQVQADRATIEARLSDAARLSEQVRALTALRDQLERQAAEAARRAGDEAQRRNAAEAAAGTEAERRQAAERAAATEQERRRAAEALAAEEAQRRQAAERAAGEQGRLAESARAQVALLGRQIEELRNQLARVAAALDAAETSGRDKDVQISALGSRLNAALAARVEELQRYRSDFFGRLRDVLGDRPDMRIVGDRFVFQSEVLFPPGSADLSERGQQQIRAIARVLQDLAARIPPDVNWLLRVDGHADRTPIRSPRYASNWELSAARAIAVSQLLMAEGLPPNRVAATAFGDNQPLDLGESPEALARNRRIELRLTDR
ncbi:peptidoglycan -binding protein [Belnapia rosea]|uniref:peptidoglycan -binding protein n=1 Tax=Belnapia rosea TaxID=938405 RepID=UPI0008800F13|nr:peptidoglycan -binding protein [Belnapia rosea]SDB68046.1 chemotaxis protein MotB [Belnapia rosea]